MGGKSSKIKSVPTKDDSQTQPKPVVKESKRNIKVLSTKDDSQTQFKWEVYRFHEFDLTERSTSHHFSLSGLPSVKWSLFYDRNHSSIRDSTFGVVLEESKDGKVMCVQIKLWAEDSYGKKMFEWKVKEHEFRKVGCTCVFDLKSDVDLDAYNNHGDVILYCEIKLITPINHSQNTCEFRQKMWEYYQAGFEKDVSIKVGDRKFTVSRSILTSQCEVFNNMLSSNCKEGNTGVIEIKDFEAKTVEYFVKWLYLGVVESEDLIEKLSLFADKYLIQDLKEQCADVMMFSLTDGNVIDRLALSIDFKSEKLKNAALNFIASKAEIERMKFLTSDNWRDFMSQDNELTEQIMKELCAKLQ